MAPCESKGGLSFGAMLAYCNMFLSINAFYAIFQSTRGYVYRDK